jgi:phosphatidylglycerophosphatase A
MNLRLSKVIASGFGTGFLPLAPGTWASALAVGLWFLSGKFFDFTPLLQLVICSLAMLAGFYTCIKLEEEWGKDPSQIVIDEWAGMWISVLFLPFEIRYMLAAFVLFRVLDIWKPLYIGRMEKISGGSGVMLDDILAGLTVCLLLHLFIRL